MKDIFGNDNLIGLLVNETYGEINSSPGIGDSKHISFDAQYKVGQILDCLEEIKFYFKDKNKCSLNVLDKKEGFFRMSLNQLTIDFPENWGIFALVAQAIKKSTHYLAVIDRGNDESRLVEILGFHSLVIFFDGQFTYLCGVATDDQDLAYMLETATAKFWELTQNLDKASKKVA